MNITKKHWIYWAIVDKLGKYGQNRRKSTHNIVAGLFMVDNFSNICYTKYQITGPTFIYMNEALFDIK